ncbi:WD40 repeat domain-containing protein [Streptomyces canus]|uniref:WD40 repeat domain-containing protein n=1 Tax=Streptomyces canus TaxID=58343 RepID=UPI0037133651
MGRVPEPVRPGDVPLSWQPGVRSFAFSQDGSRVAVGYQTGGTDVFDLGGHVVAALRRDDARAAPLTRAARLMGVRADSAVTCLALTPNGGQLVTAQDATARIWSVAKSVELRQMRLPDAVCAVSFSPVGHRVAFATVAPAAYVWDTRDPTARRRGGIGARFADDVYGKLKEALRRTPREPDPGRERAVVLQDTETGVRILLGRELDDSAFDALRDLDLTGFGSGTLRYDTTEARWVPVPADDSLV